MSKLEEKYDLSATISVVIGCVIGAGIFFKVDDILTATQGNVLAGLIGWICVGASVISGATVLSYYAEILPKEGGLIKYSEYRFGSKFGFFVGWFYMTVYYPILGAVLFTVGSEFLLSLVNLFIKFEILPIHNMILGTAVMLIFFVINTLKPKVGGIIQSVTTVLKTIPLILIAVIGIVIIFKGEVTEQNTLTYAMNNINENQSLLGLVLASFIPIAFAFDGWYIVTQISGEVKNSKRNLPIALIVGTLTVAVIYTFYYLGVVFDLGGDAVSELGNNYISKYAEIHGGELGSALMLLAIVISIYGAGNGILMAGIRVPYQLVNSGTAKNFFNVLKVDEKRKSPINSAIFFLGITLLYLLIYYITNTLDFFKAMNFDLSSLPVTFVYVIMTVLFIGMFKIISENKVSGNKYIKYFIACLAILGSIIVLYGGITTSNGLLYIFISLVVLSIGLTVIKNKK